MGDYHVDRLEVYAQQCVQLTSTNRPKTFLSKTEPKVSLSEKYCGGYSSVGPPLPIPNREVKHTNADGTAPPGGRVGRCRFSDARLIKFSRASLLLHHLQESRHSCGGLLANMYYAGVVDGDVGRVDNVNRRIWRSIAVEPGCRIDRKGSADNKNYIRG